MTLMNTPKVLMIMMGVYPAQFIKSSLRRFCYTIYRYFNWTCISIFYNFVCAECIFLTASPHIVPERKNSSFAVAFAITYIITRMLMYCRNRLTYMCQMVLEKEQIITNTVDDEIKKLHQKATKYAQFLYSSVVFSISMAVISYAIEGFVTLCKVGLDAWNFEEKSFMYELYFPVDKHKFFGLFAIFNVYLAYLMGTIRITGDVMFYSLLVFAKLRLEILQCRIRKYGMIRKKDDVRPVLLEFIREHQEIISFIENLNRSTRYPLMLEFLLNSFNLASVLFQIITIPAAKELAFPLLFFSFLAMEIFFVGWTANEIKVQSSAISDALYNTDWYDQDDYVKKLLHFMMLRCQKPILLTIGPFSPMTTDTIIWMFKASYSYLTVMRNRYNKLKGDM